MHMRVKTHIR